MTAAAWKVLFDGYLRERAARKGEPFVAFDPVADYDEYLDGKPRYDRSPGDAPAEQQAGRAVITEGYSL